MHGEPREDVVALRDVREAAAYNLMARKASDTFPAKKDLSALDLDSADDRFKNRRLAGAIRAYDAHDFALVDPESYAAKDINLSRVRGGDVADFQQRLGSFFRHGHQVPMYASTTASLRRTASGVSDAMTAPFAITMTKSA